MKIKKMKTTLQTVTLTALFFLFACAGPAAADTLGNTLAKDLCGNIHQTYRLTSTQLLQWSGLDVHGAYSTNSAGATTSYYFWKAASNDNEATCKKSSKTASGTDCQQWKVYRNKQILTKSTSASRCD
jgi:hypothetical protein